MSCTFLSRPLDFSLTPMASVQAAVNKNHPKFKDDIQTPQAFIAEFYIQQHARSLVSINKDESKCAEFLNDYAQDIASKATRLFTYMMFIVSRESRHAGYLSHASNANEETIDLVKNLSGSGSDGSVERFKNFKFNTLNVGTYLKDLEEVFRKCSFSGGYGGDPWGDIALCLYRFVKGELNAETFIDQSCTLAHNNGPMFNKGMVFGSQETEIIETLLDIQAAGKIPQAYACFIANTSPKPLNFGWTGKVAKVYDFLMGHYFEDVSDLIDWNSIYKIAKFGVDTKSTYHDFNKYTVTTAKEDQTITGYVKKNGLAGSASKTTHNEEYKVKKAEQVPPKSKVFSISLTEAYPIEPHAHQLQGALA